MRAVAPQITSPPSRSQKYISCRAPARSRCSTRSGRIGESREWHLDHALDLVAVGLPGHGLAHEADPGGDDELRGHRLGVVEGAERLDGRARQADLLFRLAQRRLEKAGVGRIHASPGEADLAAVRADVVRALGEDEGGAAALHDGHQHRRLHERPAHDHSALAAGETSARERDQLDGGH